MLVKIWFVLAVLLLFLFSTTPLASAPVASPTVVPLNDGKSTVTVYFVVSGRVDLGEVGKLASGVTYIYNKDKTRVLVIMDVAAENARKVRDVVRQNGWEMKTGEDGEMEREFRGYKNHRKAIKNKAN